LIIDVHGHYTTAPQGLRDYREAQMKRLDDPVKGTISITDDEIRETIIQGQLKLQRERGTELALFSPTAGGMGHHIGDATVSRYWSETVNDLVYRVCTLFPESFIPVCQIPQSPGVSPANCVDELERCVNEMGFVGVNVNPDPSGGYWVDPPMTDRFWYPLYEKMVELEVPAMIHVSSSCNPNFHGTGAHYLNGDLSVFMQCIQEPQIFKDFPTLKFVIPHGGGAVPYHWGRYRGIALGMGRPELNDFLMDNIYFDTCVYHQSGMETLFKSVPIKNVLFASEMIGAVRGKDPLNDRYFDDTKMYIDKLDFLSREDLQKLYEDNARAVYPRLDRVLSAREKA
jgi:4-oxalmesaconate hydratase